MASLLVLRSAAGDAPFNMALDEALLESMPRLDVPVLRFYSWTQPAASFGYFQRYAEVSRLTLLRPLVRRPTGGGIVPHAADWTYSLAFPVTHEWYSLTALESYRRVHQWIQSAFTELNIQTDLAASPFKAAAGHCFVGYEQSDLLWRGQKIAGAAQRRRKDGLLIQGSVQPQPNSPPRAEWETAMVSVSPLLPSVVKEFDPDPLLTHRATDLALQKYSQPRYNEQR